MERGKVQLITLRRWVGGGGGPGGGEEVGMGDKEDNPNWTGRGQGRPC
jgi:hypothetical protein